MPYPKDQEPWTISIEDFGGFVPAWFENAYPFYGNKNQASDMKNADITDPNVLKPGPGVVALTGGTQAGAVTTLIRSILRHAVSDNVSYACGGNKYHKISATAVTNSGGTYPYTIDKATVTGEDAEDLVYHKSIVYVFYNHSGSAGDILKDNAGTIDVDWGSTVPTGMGTLQNAPHQAMNGGDDDAYFANGRYIGAIRASGTLVLDALDFWTNAEVSSITWNYNRVIAAVSRPNIAGSNFNQSAVYVWNGYSSSWEGDPIEVSGKIGALYTKNGVTFIWWQDSTDTGAYNFGYIGSGRINPLRRYEGGLPLYYQVGEYKGFIAWASGGLIYLWGSKDIDVPIIFFQYMEGSYATIGGIASPFGELLIASNATTNYDIAKPSGYVTDFTWNTKAFRVGGPGFISQVDLIEVETEPLVSGARANFTLTYDKGKSTLALDSIIYAVATNITKHKLASKYPQVEDFRIDITNASSTTLTRIRSILIKGHYILKN
jgi:hypothetical protein